jgi:phosphoribosylaminoimidazole-succinocarboxamide synthase
MDVQDTAFRGMFRLQRRIHQAAESRRLRLEKYLGDGAFYSGRFATHLLAAAVHAQRIYRQALAEGLPFDRGMRLALNYSEYRLLPIAGADGERYEFFGHGVIELTRLTTGKAMREIDEVKAMLLAMGYPEQAVHRFFAPLQSDDRADREAARPFRAWLDRNGHLVNEGIVATEAFVAALDTEVGVRPLTHAADGDRGFVVLHLDDPAGWARHRPAPARRRQPEGPRPCDRLRGGRRRTPRRHPGAGGGGKPRRGPRPPGGGHPDRGGGMSGPSRPPNDEETRVPGPALIASNLPGLPPPRRGKVRDVYDLGDALLLVASDRLSAYDHVLSPGIPDKGKLLTQLSTFWFERLVRLVPHHLLATRTAEVLARLPPACAGHRTSSPAARSSSARPQVVPFECVARGYLAGSAFREYREGGTVCGLPLPPGLERADRLPEPVFTPATKAESGHDENVSFETMAAAVGADLAAGCATSPSPSTALGADHAATCGLLLADTKLEFGLAGGELLLIDEALTPDSSRYWEAATWRPGEEPASFDKQYVRNWLDASGWDHESPPPELPTEVVAGTRRTLPRGLPSVDRKGTGAVSSRRDHSTLDTSAAKH